MLKSLWIKFLLLLFAVCLIAISTAFAVREFMISDFREYLDGEREDRAYQITASLESSFDKHSGWDREAAVENTVWALMLGFDLELYDEKGTPVMDTDQALESVSQLVKKRIAGILEARSASVESDYVPYGLFLGGREIGQVKLRFLDPHKEKVFVRRSDRFLILAIMILGGFAIMVSILFSKKMTDPIKGLTKAAVDLGEGDLKRRVEISGGDEIGRLAGAFNRMAQALETHESLRRRLTANVAHELRTPLGAMRGELEAMIDGYIPAERDNLYSLYAEIGRLRKLLDGIEELSRAEASSLNLDRQSFELGPFLRSITDRLAASSEDRGISLELHCDEGLVIRADPDRLSQIAINLVSNAIKACGPGGRVVIAAARQENGVRISITDNGSGIKEEDLPLIFERFHKLSGNGLGIGLTIVKELVEAHGGKVTASSEYGKGSEFTVFIPSE
jgi:two-component system sensor histidine kinase BaeS